MAITAEDAEVWLARARREQARVPKCGEPVPGAVPDDSTCYLPQNHKGNHYSERMLIRKTW